MLVVLDTNIIVGDFQLKGTAAKVFLSELSRTQHSLHIPQIVFDEVVNKYRDFLEQYNRDLKKLQQDIKKRVRSQLASFDTPIQVSQMVVEYETNLSKDLEAVNASYIPYPTTSHEIMARRAMDRKKPFSETGAGYRDALIWQNILVILGEPNNIVGFITADKDFANKYGELYPELKDDLTQLNIGHDRIKIYASLDEFVEKELKPGFKRIEDIRAQLNRGKYPGLDLVSTIDAKLEYVELPISGWGSNQVQTGASDVGLPPYAENPSLVHADIKEFDVLDVRETSSGEFFIEVEARAEVLLDFYIFKADWWIEEDNDDDISLVDTNWNEHYMLGEATREVQMNISLTFTPTLSNVTSLELRKIELAE